jgi:hypothetical protein
VLLDEFLMAMGAARNARQEAESFAKANLMDHHPLDPLFEVFTANRTPQDLAESIDGLYNRFTYVRVWMSPAVFILPV